MHTRSHSRRDFIATTAAAATLCFPAVHTFAEEKASEILIGIAADAQYADAIPKGNRYYREGDNRLANAVTAFNKQKVDCCFHLGDLIDHNFESFDNCMEVLEQLESPCYQVLGNHDFDVDDEKKADVPTRMGLEQRYYSMTLNKFRFVMLDGTDISTYASSKEDPRTKSAHDDLKALQAAKAPNAQTWNGGMGKKQLAWLVDELTAATEAAERVIVMCHYPVFPANVHNLWNDKQVLDLVDKHPSVVAWFNGHNHAGNYGIRDGVHFTTLQGIVEHKETSAFATAVISDNEMQLTGFGREPSRELKFRD